MTTPNDNGAYCTRSEVPCAYCKAGECVWRLTLKEQFEKGMLIIDDTTNNDNT